MAIDAPYICEDDSDSVCWICPALRLPAGRFDVYDKPTAASPFDPQTGYRYDAQGVAVCVHPYKLGVPAGRYASAGEPFPALAKPSRPKPRRDEPVSVAVVRKRAFPGPEPMPSSLVSDADIMAGERPQVPAELLAWMRGLVSDAAPDDLASTLEQAELAARRKFPAEAVIEALRRVLGGA